MRSSRSITTTNSTILDNLLFLRIRIPVSLVYFCIFTILLLPPIRAGPAKRQCKKVGVEEIIDEDGCELLILHINRCSGYCHSMTYWNPLKMETGVFAKCCRMSEWEMVETEIKCPGGNRQIRIPSATHCECFDCAVQ